MIPLFSGSGPRFWCNIFAPLNAPLKAPLKTSLTKLYFNKSIQCTNNKELNTFYSFGLVSSLSSSSAKVWTVNGQTIAKIFKVAFKGVFKGAKFCTRIGALILAKKPNFRLWSGSRSGIKTHLIHSAGFVWKFNLGLLLYFSLFRVFFCPLFLYWMKLEKETIPRF